MTEKRPSDRIDDFSVHCSEFVQDLVMPSVEALAALPRDIALRFSVAPIGIFDSRLWVAIPDPLDFALFDTLNRLLDRELEFIAAPPQEIKRILDACYP